MNVNDLFDDDKFFEELSAAQRSVKQMGAEFQPHSIRAVGSKTDPAHPADGYLVGEDQETDNFTADDIKKLERIRDLETLKAQAKQLIKGKPQKRMKPEKIAFFYNRVDDMKSPMAVIKMMYDLYLAGEGHKVIGTKNSMSNNSYRQRFGEEHSVAEGKKHISPSGVETNMDPSDDDYEINYGKNGNVAKFRKKQGVDVKTGNKKAANESVAVNPPKFPDDWSEEKKRAAWQKWLRAQTKKSADAQTDVQDLANRLRKRQNTDESVEEAKKRKPSLRNPKDNPCWKGYKPVGTKKKNGKTVPNCVPKESVEEGQVVENKGSKVVQNLVDKFYNDNGIDFADGNIYVKDPGTRVWTRGDGTRYRDPGKIRTKDGDEKQLKAFFPWLIKQPGVKDLGKLSGSFASEVPGDVYAIGGIYFKLMNHDVVEWGSVSRFKNPRSVWKQTPKQQGVSESNDSDSVADLKARLLNQKSKLQQADKDQLYNMIDSIMQRVSKNHGISSKKLHHMWVDTHSQVPDAWIKKQQGVTESNDNNAVASAIFQRIITARSDLLKKYGPVHLEQAIMDVADRAGDVDEIGTSDVSILVSEVERSLRELGNRSTSGSGMLSEMDMNSPEFQQALARLKKLAAAGPLKTVRDPKTGRHKNVPVDQDKKHSIAEDNKNTYEDVLSKLKARLGDYLNDVADAVVDDGELKSDKPTGDRIDTAKTIVTDDGHEIRINGNEDDGFRITIKNKESQAQFENLREAELAVEMYCARRKKSVRPPSDFVREE